MDAIGVGQQLGQLQPVGVVVENDPDDVDAPTRLEARLTEMLERHHLVGLGPTDDPEDSVLAAEGVGDRRLTYPPPHADPGMLLDALGKAVDEHCPQSPPPYDDVDVVDFAKLGQQVATATALATALVATGTPPVFDRNAPLATYEDALALLAITSAARADFCQGADSRTSFPGVL